MDTTCPVTRAFLHTIRGLYDLKLIQNETWIEPIDELFERAQYAGSSRERQHQRAFYCIESMLCRFVLNLKFGRYMTGALPKLLSWPRSREGLNQVLKHANETRDDLLAEVTEYYYLQARPRGVEQIIHDSNHRQAELFKLICESSVILRQSLKNPEVTLTRVGKRLALATHVTNHYISDMLLIANELLEQNEGLARRAWEIPQT